MEEDLEDGEICEDKTMAATSSVGSSAAHLGETGGGGGCSRAAFNVSEAVRSKPVIQRLRTSSTSSESEGELKNNCSDDDDYGLQAVPAKRSTVNTGRETVGQCSTEASSSASGATRARKKNNIWGSVLQEQTLAKEMISWGGMEKKIKSDRDVESYDYRKAKEIRAQLEENPEEIFQSDIPEIIVDVNPDLDDLETFGTGPTKSRSCRKGARDPQDDDDEGADGDNSTADNENKKKDKRIIWRKRTHGNRNQATATATTEGRASVKSRLGRRTFDESKDRSHVKTSAEDSAEDVARELMRVLGEPETMLDMFQKVVEIAGAQEALNLLYITEDLEEAGGVLTMDGSRRRTAGGVYLFLVKTELSKEQTDAIFEQQRQRERQTWKDKRQHRFNNAVGQAQDNLTRCSWKAQDRFANSNNNSNGDSIEDSNSGDLLVSNEDNGDGIHGSTEAIYGSTEAIHGQTDNGHDLAANCQDPSSSAIFSVQNLSSTDICSTKNLDSGAIGSLQNLDSIQTFGSVQNPDSTHTFSSVTLGSNQNPDITLTSHSSSVTSLFSAQNLGSTPTLGFAKTISSAQTHLNTPQTAGELEDGEIMDEDSMDAMGDLVGGADGMGMDAVGAGDMPGVVKNHEVGKEEGLLDDSGDAGIVLDLM